MNINETLLSVHDGERLNGRDHFELKNKGLLDRFGKLTDAGKEAIKPVIAARKEAEKRAAAQAEAAAKVKKGK